MCRWLSPSTSWWRRFRYNRFPMSPSRPLYDTSNRCNKWVFEWSRYHRYHEFRDHRRGRWGRIAALHYPVSAGRHGGIVDIPYYAIGVPGSQGAGSAIIFEQVLRVNRNSLCPGCRP